MTDDAQPLSAIEEQEIRVEQLDQDTADGDRQKRVPALPHGFLPKANPT